jgi:hypothetical protein
VTLGSTLQLYATVSPANATNNTVTWSVVDGTGTATISSDGLLTAVESGIVTVKATANDGSGIFGTLDIVIIEEARFEATGNTGPHDGKVYIEYEMQDADGSKIDLSDANIVTINVDGKELIPNSDTTLYVNAEKEAGQYTYTVVTKDGKRYKAELDWAGPVAGAAFEETGRAGEHEGETYVEYALKVNGVKVDLDSFEAMYQIKEDGTVAELEANSDTTLWFNTKSEGTKKFIVIKDGKIYVASITFALKEIAVENINIANATNITFESVAVDSIKINNAVVAMTGTTAPYATYADGTYTVTLAADNSLKVGLNTIILNKIGYKEKEITVDYTGVVVENIDELKTAINEANNGETIVLRAGEYQLTETLEITKSITILGPQADVDPRPGKNSTRTDDTKEAILTGDKGDDSDPISKDDAKNKGWLASIFKIKAHNVVINGLTLERAYDYMVYSKPVDIEGGGSEDVTGLQILNNIVRQGRGNEGIKVGNSVDALVQYNYITDIRYGGDAIEAYNVKGFRILENEIDGCDSVNGNIRVCNLVGGTEGIIRGNIIKNTGYHFAINAEDGTGDIVIDNNDIRNAEAGGIFVYKNTGNVSITNNKIDNYATAPVTGGGYRESYLRNGASAIFVSYNLPEDIEQPEITIRGNITSNGADSVPVMCFGGGTTDASAIPTDISKIVIENNTFDNPYIKDIKTSGLLNAYNNSVSYDGDINSLVADAADNSIILLDAGNYTLTGGVVPNKNITIIGANKENTIIDATNQGTYGAFQATNGHKLTLQNITFKTDNPTDVSARNGHYVVGTGLGTGSTEIVIDNCIINGYYTAVYMNNVNANNNKLTMTNNTIINCDWAYSIDNITVGAQDIKPENLVFTGNTGDGAEKGREVFASVKILLIGSNGASKGSYGTIQAAIDAAGTGDTIRVAPGEYSNFHIPNGKDNLTLLGANAGISAGVEPGERGPESVIEGNITTGSGASAWSENLTIDGFTIKADRAFNSLRTKGDIIIENNIIDGLNPELDGSGNFALAFVDFNSYRVFIRNNLIKDARIAFTNSGTNLIGGEITGNVINNTLKAIEIGSALDKIENNIINNSAELGLRLRDRSEGTVVKNNEFNNNVIQVLDERDSHQLKDILFENTFTPESGIYRNKIIPAVEKSYSTDFEDLTHRDPNDSEPLINDPRPECNWSGNGKSGVEGGTYDAEIIRLDDSHGKVFRISNPCKSGNYAYTHPTTPALIKIGETGSGGIQGTFSFSFEFKSVSEAVYQEGLKVSVTPIDFGTSNRQGILQIYDNSEDGFSVYWHEYDEGKFKVKQLATDLDRSKWHKVEVEMTFIDGENNDVVNINLNGKSFSAKTWEEWYPDDGVHPRVSPVDCIIFRIAEGGGPDGGGVYFDNLNTKSIPMKIN